MGIEMLPRNTPPIESPQTSEGFQVTSPASTPTYELVELASVLIFPMRINKDFGIY